MKYQVLPDLTPIEFEALKADIAERGVLVPVEVDECGEVLDGHHRIRAWQELREDGVPLPDYPRMVRTGLTEEQKRNHARSLNVLRRQLSKEQRDAVMQAMRADHATYQEIAAAVGVSEATAWRKTSQISNEISGIENGRGQVRPATYAPRNSKNPETFTAEMPMPQILEGASLVWGPAGKYWQTGESKECDKCHKLWMADIPYCPYCNVSPEARIYHAQQERKPLPLTAANHAVSFDPDYDGDEWYTPAEYINAAREVMGAIDLDPASCFEAQETIQATEFFTKQDDALQASISWHGRIFLNPPYSTSLVRQFVTKLIAEYDNGNVTQAIILTNNSSDTGWFHDLLSRFPACFTKGRVQFWRADNATFGARQGQTLFYLGDQESKFRSVFSQFGIVVVKA